MCKTPKSILVLALFLWTACEKTAPQSVPPTPETAGVSKPPAPTFLPTVFSGPAPEHFECARTKDCINDGVCGFARDKGCVDATDSQALDGVPQACSLTCREVGGCHKSEDGCVAKSDSDCQRSNACSEHGACHASDGYCRVKSDEDCQKSNGCEKHGMCAFRNGGCYATEDAHCETKCLEPPCEALDGHCWSNPQCPKTCVKHGVCRASIYSGEFGNCESMKCVDTKLCKKDGFCQLVQTEIGPRCFATEQGCKQSTGCKERGECELLDLFGVKYCGAATGP